MKIAMKWLLISKFKQGQHSGDVRTGAGLLAGSTQIRPELHDTGLLFVSDWLALSNTKVVLFCYTIPD